MFLFGVEAGDNSLPRVDDESGGEITLSTPFPLFGTTESSLFVIPLYVPVILRAG